MEREPSIDFFVSATRGRPEIVIIPESDAQFLAGALTGLAPEAEMPNSRSIALRIESALESESELLELPPHQERELLIALDRIALQMNRVLSADLLRLRSALADAVELER